MTNLETLQDVIKYIKAKHTSLLKHGAYGMRFVRQPDGRRILIEDFDGCRAFQYKVQDDNTLIMTNFLSGFTFKGNNNIQMTSRCIMPHLAVINIYDHAAEFFSTEGIDFVYTENGFSLHKEKIIG